MKLVASTTQSLQADVQAELRNLGRAVASGTREAGRGLKAEPRRQVAGDGLGPPLARSWRDRHYDNRGTDAASLVCTKAPHIVRAFEGAPIRSGAAWLVIPPPPRPRARDRREE